MNCSCQHTSSQGLKCESEAEAEAGAHHNVRPLIVSKRSLGWKLSRSTPHPFRSCRSCATMRSLQGPSQLLFSSADWLLPFSCATQQHIITAEQLMHRLPPRSAASHSHTWAFQRMASLGAVRHIGRARTQNAHMPQHMAPRGFRSSQGSQLLSRKSRLGFTDISSTQGMGCRKLLLLSSAPVWNKN